jgi:hypothetical protein
VHALAVVQHDFVVEAVPGARAEEKISEVVKVAARRPSGPGELPGVSILAILRIEIEDVSVDGLELVASLPDVAAI